MLNPFPELLSLTPFAPFFLRVAIGTFFLSLAFYHYQKRLEIRATLAQKWGAFGKMSSVTLPFAELLLAILLLIGIYTQYAAVFALLVLTKALVLRKVYGVIFYQSVWAYTFALIIALSLLITGAGVFAFDIPL